MGPLTITARVGAIGPLLEITGDLDHHTAPELRRAVEALTLTRGQLLVLDLAGLEFCDSSGITVLLGARNIAIEHGTELALAAIPGNLARVLRMVGLDQVFTIHSDAATATDSQPPTATRSQTASRHTYTVP